MMIKGGERVYIRGFTATEIRWVLDGLDLLYEVAKEEGDDEKANALADLAIRLPNRVQRDRN